MQQRLLASAILSTCLVLSVWIFLLVELQDSEFTLGFLGNTLDIINPIRVPVNSSKSKIPLATATPSLNNPLAPLEEFSTASLSRPPYYDTKSEFFNRTFVVSLPSRMDRRISMERLRQYISANWTYVDAVNAEDKEISWILECIRSMREGSAASIPTEEFAWPQEFEPNPGISHVDSVANETLSWCPRPDTSTGSSAEVATIGQRPDLRPLTCAARNLTDGPPYSPALPPYMVLTPSKVACWRSHIQILERFAYEKALNASTAHEAALILEDDVDMERDIRKRLRNIWTTLSRVDWDIVFLGHCWSNEDYHPEIATLSPADHKHRATTLHPSLAPKCTHAYAVSRSGAFKLLQHLQHPPFAYSRALDQAYSWLILSGRIQSYSIVPSLVVQRKVTASDVDAGDSGVGSTWRDSLDDGILAA